MMFLLDRRTPLEMVHLRHDIENERDHRQVSPCLVEHREIVEFDHQQ
jgi:hypothetical protein